MPRRLFGTVWGLCINVLHWVSIGEYTRDIGYHGAVLRLTPLAEYINLIKLTVNWHAQRKCLWATHQPTIHTSAYHQLRLLVPIMVNGCAKRFRVCPDC